MISEIRPEGARLRPWPHRRALGTPEANTWGRVGRAAQHLTSVERTARVMSRSRATRRSPLPCGSRMYGYAGLCRFSPPARGGRGRATWGASRQCHAPAVPPRTPSRAVAVWTHLGDHGGDRRGVRSLLRNHRAESIPYHLDQLADDGDGSWVALGEPGQVSEKLGAFRGCGDDRGVAAALFCHGSVLSRARFQTSWSTLSWSSPRGWHRREWSAPGLSGWTALVSRFRAFHAYLVALRR